MKLQRNTARMIVLKKGQLLVMERWRREEETGEMLHYFSIPGGAIEKDETPAEAALREIEEEMGITVELGPEIATVDAAAGQRFYFLGYHKKGTPSLHPQSPEASENNPNNRFEPKWIPLDKLNKSNCHPDYQSLIPLIHQLDAGRIPVRPWHIHLDGL